MQNEVEVKGFILQIHPVKDQDCYLHLLTKEKGYLPVYVKSGLNPKSKHHVLCQAFQLVDLQLFQTEKTQYLKSGEVQARFVNLTASLTLQAEGGRLTQLVRDLTREQDCDFRKIYEILAYALHSLNQVNVDGELVFACASLRMLAVSGFALPVQCAEDEAWAEDVYTAQLSFRRPYLRSEILHPPVRRNSPLETASPPLLQRGTKEAISFVLKSPLNRVFGLKKLAPAIRVQLLEFCRHFLVYCLDKDYRGDQLQQQMQKMEELAQHLWQKRRQQNDEAAFRADETSAVYKLSH